MAPQSPYAPPKADVRKDSEAGPTEWQRAKWLFGGLWVLVTVLPLINSLLAPRPAPDIAILSLNCVVAIAVAAFVARDMWLLKVRRSPLVVDIAAYVLVPGAFAVLIVLKEAKLYDWNILHVEIPFSFLMGIVAVAAWLTETKKRVRVYVGARHFIFLPPESRS